MKPLHIALDSYEKLIDYIVETDEETILNQVAKSAKYYLGQVDINEDNMIFLQSEEDASEIFTIATGTNGPSSVISSVKNRKDDYLKVYHLLEDHFSRKTFFFILRTKLLPYDFRSLNDVRCGGYQYFRPELIEAKGQGVLVDCGGLDGGSTFDYMEVYGKDLKKAYIFEPHPDHIKVCQENTTSYPHIECINKATGKEKGVLKFDTRRGGASRFSEDGNLEVPVDTLDEIIKEPITFLKMDIEGAELDSLKGGKKHLVEDKPYLTICLYHKLEDSIDIPLYLLELNPEQNFNVRYHSSLHDTYEVVLYASPQTGNQKTQKNPNRFLPSLKEDSFMMEKENAIVIQTILKEVSKSSSTCFFGAGQVCLNALNYYQEHQLPKPKVICDNNKDLHGTKIQGIPVVSFQELLTTWDDCHIILTVGIVHQNHVYQQLLQQVPQDRISQHIQFYLKQDGKVVVRQYEGI